MVDPLMIWNLFFSIVKQNCQAQGKRQSGGPFGGKSGRRIIFDLEDDGEQDTFRG